MKKQVIISVVAIYVLLTVLFYALKGVFRFPVLETGNTLMAVLSLVTYIVVYRQLGSPQAFVRGVYSASFLKLMVCMISLLVYVLLNRENVHKPSVFVLFGIYAVYTITETWLLSKLVRDK